MSNETNGNGYGLEKPIAIYYEHPDWFRPLFQQLDERAVPWLKIDARAHHYDVDSPEREYSRVINHPSQALDGANAIGYPVVIKPNIGGSGAGIERFNSRDELRSAVEANRLYFGIDSTALVQEAFTARDGIITRVEVLGGKFLYAIRIHVTGQSYNLCPADICQN